MISNNLRDVTQRIARCCEKNGRQPEDVKLICVTKEAGIRDIEEVLTLGCKEIGENRVREALLKHKSIGDKVVWHLVGHLQTNKVRDAVKIFSLIHSVDSVRLARLIDAEAKRIGKVQGILLQVNISDERSKFGLSPAEAPLFFKEVSLYPNINILGLMTIAPEVDDLEKARPYFKRLRELRDEIISLKLTAYNLQLSMGMSNDFEAAIEEGSTMVRIGRAIFKDDK